MTGLTPSKPSSHPVPTPCLACGKLLEQKPMGAHKRYCDHRCRDKVANERYGYGYRGPKDGPDYIVNPETGCWEWQKFVLRGYPRNGHGIVTHQMLAKAHGRPVPSGYDVHHLCKVRYCVNPDHLEALPSTEHRRADKGYYSDEQVAEMRRMLAEGFTHKAIADRIGCSLGFVANVATGKRRAA